eukprot:361168-Chlamydomonas_euryale.AAC.7
MLRVAGAGATCVRAPGAPSVCVLPVPAYATDRRAPGAPSVSCVACGGCICNRQEGAWSTVCFVCCLWRVHMQQAGGRLEHRPFCVSVGALLILACVNPTPAELA